ncbi:restriction endonuclease subunit S [Pseudomonas sp. CR3202]|uniref:restriction endonuclease subunit S n=1 Tax=Pseudomonas sp. CR3202 TaxID=3351532 RepID=UPI003BF1B3C5
MNGWSTRRLGELCTEVTVGFVGKMSDQYVDAGVPFLRSQDIKPGHIDTSSLKFISPEFHHRIRKSRLSPGDVAIVRTGYPGTAAVVPDNLPDANCSDLVIARPGPSLNPRYLAFVLNSPWGKGQVNGRLVGAAQQHFNVKVAQALEILLPPLEIQRRITGVLGAYDDLIEVNRRRIAVLEDMARGLFSEWFIRLRFPGHEDVASEVTTDGPLPTGWSWGTLGDFLTLQRGFDLPSAQRVDGAFPIVSASGITGSHTESRVSGPGVATGRSGTIGQVHLVLGDFWPLNTALYVKEFKKAGPAYATLLLRHLDLSKHSTGAAVPTLNRNHVHGVKLAIAPSPLLNRFEQVAMANFKAIDVIRRESETLAAARDLLLPRLISGQLSIMQAESELEVV